MPEFFVKFDPAAVDIVFFWELFTVWLLLFMTVWESLFVETLVVLLLLKVELEETVVFLLVVFELKEFEDELTWIGWVLAKTACWLKIVLHF